MSNKKLETEIVTFNGKVVIAAELTHFEYSVLKLALKYYANEGTLSFLKRILKTENSLTVKPH